MSSLKLGAPQSVVDSSFFQKLSELKLNEFKLDTSARKLCASVDLVSVRKGQKTLVSLSEDSFKDVEEFKTNIGSLSNLNTIEEFKKTDKADFLKQRGKEVYEAISSGAALEDPSLLTTFSVLSFSDLKKYKFYYWLSFPQLHSSWRVLGQQHYTEKYQLAQDMGQFFIIEDEQNIAPLANLKSYGPDDAVTFGFRDTSGSKEHPSWELRNLLALAAFRGLKSVAVRVLHADQTSTVVSLELLEPLSGVPKITGWERTSEGKLGPKAADLGSLIDPHRLADEAVNLNLKLMKWRISPDLDLDAVQSTKCLLLGAGTLGSYVARALLGWGVQKITLVDNGKVSFSNPVRQPLFKFDDCLDGGSPKAEAAARALKEIYPSVDSQGVDLEVPMAGHPIYNESKQHRDYDKLVDLIREHDVVFLLMDSRETRWLPTVVANAHGKLVINAALGFDSYLVMRHGCHAANTENAADADNADKPRLGCYFCNDVFAPSDSLTDRSLDQMCTVTRPGVAQIASGLAVELLVSTLQHPQRQFAPASDDARDGSTTVLGAVPHQIRGFLHSFSNIKLQAPSYEYCSACSSSVVDEFKAGGWGFVKAVLNESKFLEELTGLAEVQRKAEALALDIDITDDEDEFM